MEVRFHNIIRAKKICANHDLDHLITPQAKLYKFGSNVVLAEELMDINHAESAQKEFYHKYSQDLNKAVRQLAIFVALSGFNDVTPRNIPLLNEPEDFQGSRRIVLIDLELMNSNVEGFIGSHNGSCGLIGCVTEEQMDIVIEEALKKGIVISEDRKNRRLQELASEKKLRQYHESKGITTGREFIHVDLSMLGLDLNEVEERDGKICTMQKAVADVIHEINRQIQEASDEESIQGKRYLLLNTNQEPFKQYNKLGAPGKGYWLNAEESKQIWLSRIIHALIDKGHICKLDKENGHGYFIQA